MYLLAGLMLRESLAESKNSDDEDIPSGAYMVNPMGKLSQTFH
jgi:hypothetical protein